MANNDPRWLHAEHQDSAAFSPGLAQINGNSRLGLKPTDGQDAYKRSSMRSSRRSRSERTSYLMATGHIDIEETKNLNDRQEQVEVNNDSRANLTPSKSAAAMHNISNKSADSSSLLTPNIRPGTSNGDLENLSSVHFDLNDSVFAHNNFKMAMPNKSKSNSKNRPKFRQTYTEVTLPMKTSPAFEYILKDNRRRNRRCCLWFIYSVLVTICIAIIIFCCSQIALKYYNS